MNVRSLVRMLLVHLALMASFPAVASVVYVNRYVSGTVHDGKSWATALSTVQAGINAASGGDEVWVAGTAYFENLTVPSGLALYGGFGGQETARNQRDPSANVTILDGDANAGGYANAPILEVTGGGVTIDGFFFRNGSELPSSTTSGMPGAAIRYANHPGRSDTIIISHNTIAWCFGSAVFCGVGSVPTITNNWIHNNTRSTEGGGIRLNGSVAVIRDNLIAANSVAGAAGGIRIYASEATVTNNTIVDCPDASAISIGSFGQPVRCANNLIAFNAGGIGLDPGSNTAGLVVSHNDVYANSSWNYNVLSDPTGANGNISDNPLFVNRANGDYHVTLASPCFNAGDDSYVQPGETDLAGSLRIINSHVDIGAYERGMTKVLYVNKNAPGSVHDGASWQTAFISIQDAVNASTVDTEAWVASGVYGSVSISSAAALFGGFAGAETDRSQRDWKKNVTILDGGGTGMVVTSLMSSADPVVVDGFTMRNGLSDFYGAVWVNGGSVVFANNLITGMNGTGLSFSPMNGTLVNNLITANNGTGLVLGSAAAMRNVIAGNEDGVVMQGPGPLQGNVVSGNSGSGVEMDWSGTTSLTDNAVFGNGGDGIYEYGGTLNLVGNTVSGNAGNGLAIYAGAATVTDTISGFNTGCGVYVSKGSKVSQFSHNDVYGNIQADYSGMADPAGANGNQSLDPQFVDPDNGVFQLRPDSPCVDGGDDSAVVGGDMSLPGNARIVGRHVDIGAYECPTPGYGSVVYVDASAAGAVNDGASWVTAFNTIQEGIDAAPLGGEVWVAKGTYYGNGMMLKPGISLYGGFSGAETMRSQRVTTRNVTTLNGGADTFGFAPNPILAIAGGGTTIDGFTFRNGSESISASSAGTPGAAIRYANHPGASDAFTISQCDLGNCYGSAIYCGIGSIPTISHNRIHNNVRGVEGGAIRTNGSRIYIADNLISENSVTSSAGGIRIYASSATITNNTIVKCADATGIGIASIGQPVVCANNIIAFNAGGVGVDPGSSTGAITWLGNDVYGNTSWNFNVLTDPTGTNGNIGADPKLVNPSASDYHLSAASPCLDAGVDSFVSSGETDLDGRARILGTHADMGAYERVAPKVIFVNQNSSGLVHNGSTWAKACLTVQSAINAAKPGDELWVAGSYTEHLTVSQGVAMYGGFAGTETQRGQRNWKVNQTLLSGGGTGCVVSFASGCGPDTVVDGFKIAGGTGVLVSNDPEHYGGGIYCVNSSPTIRNNIVTGNRCEGWISSAIHPQFFGGGSGGGIYLENSNAMVLGNTVSGNMCWDAGGGYWLQAERLRFAQTSLLRMLP